MRCKRFALSIFKLNAHSTTKYCPEAALARSLKQKAQERMEICRSDNEPVNDINDTSRTSLNHPGPAI